MAAGDRFEKMRGVTGNLLMVGLGGPNVKNSSGVVEVRNNADSALAVLRAAEPVGTTDVATKNYVDTAGFPANAERVIEFTVGTTTASSVATIPASADVHRAEVAVTTAYSAGGTVAIAASASLMASDTDIDEQTIAEYIKDQNTDVGGSAIAVTATVGGTPVAGAAKVTVWYTAPSA